MNKEFSIKQILNWAFGIGFVLIIFFSMFLNSMVYLIAPNTLLRLITYLGWFLIGIFIIMKRYDNFGDFAFIAIVFVLAALQSYLLKDTTFLYMFILCVGCYGVNSENIVKLHFYSRLTALIIIIGLSLLGIIPDLVFLRDGIARHSFGISYPTNFASHVFYLFISYLFLKKERPKFKTLIFSLLIAFLLLKFTDARLDSFLIFISVLLFYIAGLNSSKNIKKIFYVVGIIVFPILLILIFYINKIYTPNNAILKNLNKLMSNRLSIGNDTINRFPINLFGNKITQVGNGGIQGLNRNSLVDQYYYIDSSYIRLIYMQGIISTIIVTIMNIWLGFKAWIYKNWKVSLLILLCAIHDIIAQFSINIIFSPLLLLLFSKMDCDSKN